MPFFPVYLLSLPKDIFCWSCQEFLLSITNKLKKPQLKKFNYSPKQGELIFSLEAMGTDCNIQMTTSTLKTNKRQYLFTQHEIMLRKLMDIGCH